MRFLMLIGFAITASCGPGDKEDKPVQSATGNMVNPLEPPVVNQAVVAERRLPPPTNFSMPDFAPQYPGGVIQSVKNAESRPGTHHEVTLVTKDDAAKVVDFYRDRFAAAGLRKTSDFMSGGTAMMSAIGKGRQVSVAITKEQDPNAVIVTYIGE